jgi:hypothetical protein
MKKQETVVIDSVTNNSTNTEKRGPGRPRQNMTKMIRVVFHNGMWQAAGRGKPNAAVQRKEIPVAWNWKLGDPISI